ncbi:MAG: Hpt domain-containing protein [Proteobacteria bacterium]|nr:Hpt domain-containing protein [Pseudomonadota bacterium]
MTTDNDSPVLIDLDFFESRRQIGEDFLEKLVEVFSLEAPKLINKIKVLVKERNQADLADSGHKFKGMCLNVGADKLSILGKTIESFAKAGNIDELDDVVKELDNVLVNTLSEMKKLTK